MDVEDSLQRRIEMRMKPSEEHQVRFGEVALCGGAMQADQSLEQALTPKIEAGKITIVVRLHEPPEKLRAREIGVRDEVAHAGQRFTGPGREMILQRIQLLKLPELFFGGERGAFSKDGGCSSANGRRQRQT